jgi:hypothetical protein
MHRPLRQFQCTVPFDRRSSLARAKRTDRTEARRRTRSEQAALAGGEPVAEAGDGSPASGRPGSPAAPTVQRPSITAAFRGSFRPLDFRGDLRALPKLLVHWSFFGPAALTVASTIGFITIANGNGGTLPGDSIGAIATLAFQMFVFPLPAPAGSAFIAGFGAPRASWLTGLIVGVIAAACFAVVASVAPQTISIDGSPETTRAFALQGFLVAPVGSALFAAAAAWYKRFLNLANPNRNQRRAQQARKPVQGRGNITRDRLSR